MPLTQVIETHVPDDVFAFARRYFTEDELLKVTLAVVAMNGWNRFAISFRSDPRTCRPTPQSKKTRQVRSAA